MAQAFWCEDHDEEGVMYLSTLQGEIKTMTLCASCLPDFIMGWAQSLGLIEQLLEQARAGEQQDGTDTPEFMFTGTREQWDRWVSALHSKWAKGVEGVSLEDWRKAVALRVVAPEDTPGEIGLLQDGAAEATAQALHGQAIDEQMEGM